jgi:hypothetical protein
MAPVAKVIIASDDADIIAMIEYMADLNGPKYIPMRTVDVMTTADALTGELDTAEGLRRVVVVDPLLPHLDLAATRRRLRHDDVMLVIAVSVDAHGRRHPADPGATLDLMESCVRGGATEADLRGRAVRQAEERHRQPMDVEPPAADQERADRVRTILATLPPREEQVVRLFFGIGSDGGRVDVDVIAARTGLPVSEVTDIVERARSLIRQRLSH